MDQSGNSGNELTRIPLVLGFHPALRGLVTNVLQPLWPILQEKPLVSFRRPRRSRIERNEGGAGSMKKCGKARCQICEFVDEIDEFEVNGRTYQINYSFDCDTGGMAYLIKCRQCCKLFVGSTIISFRERFNNHESRIKRYEMGRRGIPG